ISSAAFIPFVFLTLKKFLEKTTLTNALLFSTSLGLLFLCGYPTFFIYTSYIIIAILVFAAVLHFKDKPSPVNFKTAGLLAVAIIIFCCICSPAIISYWEFLPYYSRGMGITVAKAAQNPFTPFSSVSFILPNVVNKNHAWLDTDPSMRNAYVGLFVFLLFCLSLFSKYNRWQKLLLGITVFSFLLSLGSVTPLHKLCYAVLPLFNTFRHPGNIRLFTSMGIILLAACYAQKLAQMSREETKRKILLLLYIVTGVLGLTAVYCLFQDDVWKNIVAAFRHIRQPKAFLDEFTFTSFLLTQCVAQICFIVLLAYQLRKKVLNKKIMAALVAFNSLLFCWIAIPFTFVSQLKTSTINQYVQSFPPGYPPPDINASVEAGVISDSTIISLYGYANFYTKKITIQDHIITPTLNKDYESFCADKKLRSAMSDYPVAWLNDTLVAATPGALIAGKRFSIYSGKGPMPSITASNEQGVVRLTGFKPYSFTLQVNPGRPTVLSIFQQYHHNWKVKVNGEETPLLKMNIAFMGVQVPAGESVVEFVYKPTRVITAIWLSIITIFIVALFIILSAFKSKKQ
ncbi:MAG: YfhO family protein, partial [Ferruginibacter sp.]|nr:YfhO family protein [Chitinophagaceae bacterium]